MKLIKRDPDRAFIDTWLWVPKRFVNLEGTKRALTFMVADEYSGTRELLLWRETNDHILVPRSLWGTDALPYELVDCRPQHYEEIDFKTRIKLDHLPDAEGKLVPTGHDVQRRALDTLMHNPGGILQLSCGKGKTVVFLALAAALRVPTLVIIDNTTLLEQWRREVDRLVDVPGGVGLIQADVFDWKHGLVLSTYHTIAARADTMPEEIRRWFGLIGWDEGHHISAPTFAKSADLFYGRRIALTATPTRIDGTHVVYEFHVGPVIFKDLSQTIKPRIYFKWTGFEIDASNPLVNIRDRNKDIHLMKVFAHIGSLGPRLDMIHRDVHEALVQNRRKILILSNSVSTIMNLATRFLRGPSAPLYSDIPVPTAAELGEFAEPLDLARHVRKAREHDAERLRRQLENEAVNPIKREHYRTKLVEIETVLNRCRVFDKIQSELRRRQLAFIRDLEPLMGEIGVMIGDIRSEDRLRYASNSRVVLAIMKYGKEGLDAPELDTVLVADPFSQRNGLQQLMGRVLRVSNDKLEPVIVIYEDNVAPIIAMCRKLKQHLTEWAHDEGGPFSYQLVGNPKMRKQWDQTRIFTATGL
jgi:superfamily II DNA or RNA helicase